MASTISAGTTTTTALSYSADTSGVLQLQTNGTTTAVTIDTSQNATFAGKVASASSLQLATNGTTTAVTIDTNQNLLLGTTSAQARLTVGGGSIAPQATPSSFWGIDFAASGVGNPPNYITFTASATYDLASGSGLVILHSNTNGSAALFLCYAGVVLKIGGATDIVSGSVSAGSSQIGLFYNGGTGAYRIINGYSTSQALFITTIRTRTAS